MRRQLAVICLVLLTSSCSVKLGGLAIDTNEAIETPATTATALSAPAPVTVGSTVTVTVPVTSTPPLNVEPVSLAVPRVVGQRAEVAAELLATAGFDVDVSKVSPKDIVFMTEPREGKIALNGSSVLLYPRTPKVAKAKWPKEMPEVAVITDAPPVTSTTPTIAAPVPATSSEPVLPGYAEWSDGVSIKWIDPEDVECGSYDTCWGLDVYVKDGCPGGLYAEISISKDDDTVVDWTNATLGAIGPDTNAQLIFGKYGDANGGTMARVSKLSCH